MTGIGENVKFKETFFTLDDQNTTMTQQAQWQKKLPNSNLFGVAGH